MESRKPVINKYTTAIAAAGLFLASTIPGVAGESPYWAELTQRTPNLSALETAMGGLAPNVQANTRICIVDSQYTVVYDQSGSEQDAEALKNENNGVNVVQIPNTQCFHPSNFLTMSPPRPSTAAKKATSGNTSAPTKISLNTRFKEETKHYTSRKFKPEIMDNTTVRVLPEVTTKVVLSSKDINRFTCMGGRSVKDIVIPEEEEKNITVERHGSDVYVDFTVLENTATGERKYAQSPAELYILCGQEGTVYTVIGVPNQDMPAQTVQLASSDDKLKKNQSIFKDMPFEKKSMVIIKQAYRGEIEEISSYVIKKTNQRLMVLEKVGIEVVLRYVAKIEGEGLQIKQYDLKLKSDFEAEKIKVKEKYFLLPQLTQSPVAIALDNQLQIQKNHQTRLFVLEQTDL